MKVKKDDPNSIKISFGQFIVESDPLNYILKRKCGKGYTIEGYYKDLESVFRVIFEKQLRISSAKSISALLRAVRASRKDMARYAKEIDEQIKELRNARC